MKEWNDIERPEKAKYRTKSIELALALRNNKPCKVYACLPSDKFIDVVEAWDKGLINANTFIIAIENDKAIAATIKPELSKRFKFKNIHVHPGPLHTLDLSAVLAGRQVDCAFFDICGQMTGDGISI